MLDPEDQARQEIDKMLEDSVHSKGQDLLDIVLKVDAKMLFPVHTVHPEAYRKVSKKMTIVEEGIKYDL